jgi:tRNA pseudouridine55 synthase
MNGQTQLDGLLMVNKPSGCTSHDVVDFVRRKFKQKKVGHCGTLDPLATGLLMLVLGEDKAYQGTMKLGATTDSQDADGEVLETLPVPPLDLNILDSAFKKFSGDFYQTPPMVSALKKDGVPLYKLARQGKTVERQPRFVHVYHYKIHAYNQETVDFELRCSKGFYVRTYCHDIGAVLGCGAHLTRLCRTMSGNFSLDKAVAWESLQAMDSLIELEPYVISLPEISRIRRQ